MKLIAAGLFLASVATLGAGGTAGAYTQDESGPAKSNPSAHQPWPCLHDPIAPDGTVQAPRELKRLELDLVFHPEDEALRRRLAESLVSWAHQINSGTCAPPEVRWPILYRLLYHANELDPTSEIARDRLQVIRRQMKALGIEIPADEP